MTRETIAAITVINGLLALGCYALLLTVGRKMYLPLSWGALWRHLLYILGVVQLEDDGHAYVEVDETAITEAAMMQKW